MKSKTTIGWATATSGYLSKENENTNLERYMYFHVHYFFYNSQVFALAKYLQ